MLWWKKHVFENIDWKIEMLKRNLDQTYLDIESTYYEITHNKLKALEKEHQLLFEQKNYIRHKELEFNG